MSCCSDDNTHIIHGIYAGLSELLTHRHPITGEVLGASGPLAIELVEAHPEWVAGLIAMTRHHIGANAFNLPRREGLIDDFIAANPIEGVK